MTGSNIDLPPDILAARVELALAGETSDGANQVANLIIAMLRSEIAFSRSTRDALAQAFERGLSSPHLAHTNDSGYHQPSASITGLLETGAISKAISVRRNWIEAWHQVLKLRTQGVKGDEALIQAGSSFDLRLDAMRKYVRPFAGKLEQELSDASSETMRWLRSQGWSVNQLDEDLIDLATSRFIEVEARRSVMTPQNDR